MIANEQEFDESLKQLGVLYEEGKTCLLSLSILENERADYDRVFEILRDMRDLSVLNMKKVHFKTDN